MGKRQIIRSIAINNGRLTYEVPEGDSSGAWYRNGKKINNPDDYRFYDNSIGAYRRLGDILYKSTYKGNKTELKPETAETPVDMPYWNKLLQDIYDERVKSLERNKQQNIPFGDRYITLRTKGKMNLATIPINMLDSIAINTGRSNTNIATNLGLVGKESTFGGRSIPLENAIYKKRGEVNPTVYKDIIYDPYLLTTNHAYHVSKYADYEAAISKKYDTYKENKLDADKQLAAIEQEAKDAYINNSFKDNTTHYSDNLLADSFARYAADPTRYNPGQDNYVPMVNNIANEVWNEPQIQLWWNTEGNEYYKKGLSEKRRLESAGKKSK